MTPREIERATRWDTLSDGCVTLDVDTGLVQFFGEHAVDTFGADSASMVGQSFHALLDPAARDIEMAAFIDDAMAGLNRGSDETPVRGWHAEQRPLSLIVNFVRLTTCYAGAVIVEDATKNRHLNEMVRTELEVLRALREMGTASQAIIGPVGFQRDNFGQINSAGQFGYLHNGNRSPYIVPYDCVLDVMTGAIEDRTRKLLQADITGSFNIDVHVNGALVYTYDHPGPGSTFHHRFATPVALKAGDELVLMGSPRNVNPTTAEMGISIHMVRS